MLTSVMAPSLEIAEATLPCLMYDDRFRVEIVLDNADRPVGVAHDEATGTTIVAEPQRNRVRIVNGNRSATLESFSFIQIPQAVETWSGLRIDACMHPRLRQPTDLALSRDRVLYVAESAPGGRLLAFDLTRAGAPSAAVVACSLEEAPEGFFLIAVDDRDRLLALPRGGTGQPQTVMRFRRVSPWNWMPDGCAPIEAIPTSGLLAKYFGVADAEDHLVLRWIEQQPSLTRIFCCRQSSYAYAAIRQAGLVVRIAPKTGENGYG